MAIGIGEDLESENTRIQSSDNALWAKSRPTPRFTGAISA
jgi:hypothetical protein